MKVTSFPSTFLALTTANLLSRRTMASFVAASSTINSMSSSPLSLHQSPYSIDQLIPRQYEPIPTAKYTLKKLVVINRHGDRAQIAKELGESYSVTPEVTKRWTELLPQENTQQFLRTVAFTADETNPQTLRPLPPSGQVDLYTGWDFSNLPYGQLTDMGARQLMELGQRLRQNYQNHPAVVPPSLAEAASQMYCRSTNFCRTHQSLRGLLAGLFLDLSRPAEAQESSIRPVITARPRKQETLYPQADANCVAMLRRRGQIFSEDVLRRVVPAYTTLKSKMQRVFRFADGKINWLHIKEVLLCHDVHNIEPSIPLRKYVKTPENGVSLSEEELVASGDVATMTWSILYNDDTLNRMAIGRFLHELLSDMSDSDSNPLKDKTMLMYSGHDSTLVPVLCALKCFDDKWPEYGSSIQFEIVEEKGSQGKFVRVIYNDRVMYPWGSTEAWLPLETFERRLGALRLSESDYTRCCEGEDLSQFAPLQSEEEQARLKEIREDIERETKATTSGN